jgi:hypothetical protein
VTDSSKSGITLGNLYSIFYSPICLCLQQDLLIMFNALQVKIKNLETHDNYTIDADSKRDCKSPPVKQPFMSHLYPYLHKKKCTEITQMVKVLEENMINHPD